MGWRKEELLDHGEMAAVGLEELLLLVLAWMHRQHANIEFT